MPISILLSFYHDIVLPHNCYALFNILRSFRVYVHARVFVNAYESGRNYIHAFNRNFLRYNVSGKRTPLRRKLVTGLSSGSGYFFECLS